MGGVQFTAPSSIFSASSVVGARPRPAVHGGEVASFSGWGVRHEAARTRRVARGGRAKACGAA
eukprot:11179719-Lingulodinium_polyedra.AAC.1